MARRIEYQLTGYLDEEILCMPLVDDATSSHTAAAGGTDDGITFDLSDLPEDAEALVIEETEAEFPDLEASFFRSFRE